MPQTFRPVAAQEVHTAPPFRLYSQRDHRWAKKPFASGDMASSGCGPTALAMVVASLRKRSVDPWDIAQRFRADSAPGGTIWTGSKSMPIDVGRHYRLHPHWWHLDLKSVKNAVHHGALGVGVFEPGRFTTNGHFLVLEAVRDGLVHAVDPYRGRYSGWYRPSVLLGPGNAAGFWTFTA
jgi:hypothetical protein